MRKFSIKAMRSGLAVAAVFFFSFVCFLYLTFPFEVATEAVEQFLAKQTSSSGIIIRMGSIRPALPVGLWVQKLAVEHSSGSRLEFGEATAKVSLLSLLTGAVGGSVWIRDTQKGSLEIDAKIPIIDLIGGNPMPQSIEIVADNFDLDQPAGFTLGMFSKGENMNPMVAPLLQTVGVTGDLDGEIDFRLDADDPTQSRGKINLNLVKAAIKLNDPSLGLPDQVFTKGTIGADINNGSLDISKDSGIETSDLSIDFKGKVVLKNPLLASQLDVDAGIQLKGELQKNFGVFLNAFAPASAGEGKVNLQIRGPLQGASVSTF
jgi:hypothetical protein